MGAQARFKANADYCGHVTVPAELSSCDGAASVSSYRLISNFESSEINFSGLPVARITGPTVFLF